MSKLKQLKEKRASIFSQIDQLRTAADGREMTAEEQQRWDTLLADYNKVDKEVEAEERFEQIRRHQLEQAENTPAHTPEDRSAADRQYEEAFRAYLLSGSQGVTPEQRTLLQERAGLQGLHPAVSDGIGLLHGNEGERQRSAGTGQRALVGAAGRDRRFYFGFHLRPGFGFGFGFDVRFFH